MRAGLPRSAVRTVAVALLGALLGASAPSPARADVNPDATPPDADEAAVLSRLIDGRSLRTTYQPKGLTQRYGRAQILVNAPLGVVHKLVVDYGHYKEFTGGRFHASRVIGRGPWGTEVYFQLPVLDGTITLWQVFRFQELEPLAPGWAIVEGWYLKGNIGQGNAAWTLHAIDDTHTLLTFDLLVLPNFPLPQSMIDDGLRKAAGNAVEAIRDRAQEAATPAVETTAVTSPK